MPKKRKNPTEPEAELDVGRYELRRFGRRVKLEKKPMELLLLLVGRKEQLVSRQEITAKLWGSGLFIDAEPNINNVVRKIRTALGDDSEKPRFLETVVGKGYRFVGPIRVIAAQHSGTNLGYGSATSRAETGAPSERSSLAVVPFLLAGGAADDHGLCLGFADALTARLGNLQGMDVLPTAAVLSVPVEASSAEIAARLGVRFVVCGGLQNSKGVWRVSLEVLDAYLRHTCFTRKWDLDLTRLPELQDEIAKQIAAALHRPLKAHDLERRPRYTRDPLAYEEFMRGLRLSASPDAAQQEGAARQLTNAVVRDPAFSLAHAILSFVYATRHFEFDPASVWLERAEFHCHRALDLDPDLAEGHVARAFLLWGPSKNFQHVEAIAALKRALALQSNLPHAYNRLGTILAHIGLLEHARQMFERGRPFQPQKKISHSITQVYLWNHEYGAAREEIAAWRAESPGNKYPAYFAPLLAMMTENWPEAKTLLDEALVVLPDDALIISLQGAFYAMTGREMEALDCLTRACAVPKSFGHSHHAYYQNACILSLLGKRQPAFEWLEKAVSTGFACWPFFLKDPCLKNLRELGEFEVLVNSLQARYPDHLGLL